MFPIHRDRHLNCNTCPINPVQCYDIKRKYLGMKREKIPLTSPGIVYKGICLRCHPDQDPDITAQELGIQGDSSTSHLQYPRGEDAETLPRAMSPSSDEKEMQREPPVESNGCNIIENHESPDVLARLIAQHIAKNHITLPFTPQDNPLIPNSELILDSKYDDETSVLTNPTVFRDDGTFVTRAGQAFRRTEEPLLAVAEDSSDSYQEQPILPHFSDVSNAPNTVNTTYQKPTSIKGPDIITIREIISDCREAGEDNEAIDVITQALMTDNSTSISLDLAHFFMDSLLVLAQNSHDNKRRIILEDEIFRFIIDVMDIYSEISPQILCQACRVLKTLSIDSYFTQLVVQRGGCQAILQAALVCMDIESFQIVALEALRDLSSDPNGKSKLQMNDAASVVASIMQTHSKNPAIQTYGCAIIRNLAFDSNHSVRKISEIEIDAVANSVLVHPDSHDVHVEACFTLRSMASSASNLLMIHQNSRAIDALNLALEKHQDDVKKDVQILLEKLM